jgi:glycosyltransferase involved in cell wall biosynthesis
VAGRGFDLSDFSKELGSLADKDLARIHLTGERTDIPKVLSALDLFVQTSISESFSLAVIEALATERCCVCTDVVCIKDEFPKAIKTFIPGHYSELVKLVESFINMPLENRTRIGREARKILLSKYTLDNTINSYETIWRKSEVVTPKKEKPKKIIRLISRLNIGGPVIHVTLLNKHFNNKDYSSTLVTGIHSANEGDMSYLASQYNVEPIVLKGLGREISPLDDLKVLFQLIWLFLREKPDIVHTHTAKAGTLGRLAATLTRVPQVYHTFHGHVFEGYFSPLKTRIFILIERFLALCSTGIIAISKEQKKDLLRFKIAPARKISVIPLGFDFGRILPVDPEAKLKRDLKIPDDKIVVAIIGRITQIKNHALFFRIAYEVLRLTDRVHFLVIGDGELRQHYEAETRRLKIAHQVSFTGFITDLKLIYGSVDMVVLTSLNEGTPVSLLEAMACQKIVLTTKVGGVSDFIENGINGFYFDFEADKFRDVILDYVADPAKFAAIGARAASDILSKFDKTRLFTDLEKLYRSN